MRLRTLIIRCLLVGCGLALSIPLRAALHIVEATNAPISPPIYHGLSQHAAFVERAKAGGIDILFIGDSLVDYLQGEPIWETYRQHNGACFGVPGDTSDGLLWRIRNGELDGISPQAIILWIGSNDCEAARPIDGVVSNIRQALAEIRSRCPKSRVLLLAIIPRGPAASEVRRRIELVDAQLPGVAMAAGANYLDASEIFARHGEALSVDLMPDMVHPSPKGYRLLNERLLPLVRGMSWGAMR